MSIKTDISRKPSLHSVQTVDYVGFSNFPNQVFRRCIKNGFEFTLMVVGQSGLGKSTFLNSLFLAEVYDTKQVKKEIPSTVKIESKTVRLVEKHVRLTMTFVDTPGFGDLVDNSKCWDPIVKFVDDRFSEYLNEETKVDRSSTIKDNRVHLCLYFVAPTGHRLKPLDIEFIRALQDRVNIVPVIAKADTFTPDELHKFKKNILEDFEKHNLKLYEFPEAELPSYEKKHGLHTDMAEQRKRIPFAVVGSNQVKKVDEIRQVRVREYPWGTVEVENMKHNDFIALRDMVIRNNLIDLIEMTRSVHYENFRIRQIGSSSVKGATETDPFTQLEQERSLLNARAAATREAKEQIFREKVAAKEEKLREKELAMDEEEKQNNKIIAEKKTEIERLSAEIAELRGGGRTNFTDSGSSLNSEKSKKKTLGLFGRH